MRIFQKSLPILAALCLFGAAAAWASTTGSISGIVTDSSGSVVPNAPVTATNVDTGVQATIKTDGAGFYNFPDLPVGNYSIEVARTGFKTFVKTAIRIDANSAVRVDVKLEIGEIAEKVTVRSDVVQVETQSTQMGEVIGTDKILATPLNGRDFTNLLSLQPGVVPFAYADALQDDNLSDRTVGGSGTLNTGVQSINGQRETSNGFMVNGATVQEGKNNGTAIIPNLDSIEEFRIITNNFDAEYGNYSGGQVNVITKSGTNAYHGSLFEFLRNTDLDARNYFTGPIGKLIQNQFGGTVGGPIKKDKLFFFADYQGTRQIFGPTMTAEVPDGTLDAAGNYDLSAAQQLVLATAAETAANPANMTSVGTVQSDLLADRLGVVYNANAPFPYFTGPTMANPNRPVCSSAAQCVFPNGVIPSKDLNMAASKLLPFVPSPNVLNNSAFNYSTSAFDRRLRDDKLGGRLDYTTASYGTLSAYWHGDDSTVHDPYPAAGATVASPNIGAYTALSRTRAQVIMLSDTKSFGSTAVNEFRFSYLRNAAHLFTPVGGTGITLASLGFTVPLTCVPEMPPPPFNGGICPVAPQFEGVPAIDFTGSLNGTNIGVPPDSPNQFNNVFQWQDNFSKIVGRHSLKFGGQFHYDQINYRNYFGENGDFTFTNGTESGADFVDFLIGAPSTFIQATQQLLDSRTKYAGLYIQDSWRVTSDLTFNYGLRWEMIQPWYDTGGKIETLVPGLQSVLFPGAPTGWVLPGDPGIPSTLAPTQYNNFGPRLGLAYSPSWDSGFLAKLTGGPGKTSIRAGYGLFYTSLEDLTQFQEVGDVPYGLFFVTSGTFLDTPFEPRSSSNFPIIQRFPFMFPPKNVSAKNPDPNFCWMAGEMLPNGTTCAGGVLPIAGDLAYAHGNVTPYAEDYELSIQRQIGPKTLVSVSYVGTQAHHLLTSIESNPASAALCQQLNAAGATPTCGPFGESGVYTLPPGAGFSVVPVANANPAVQLTNQPCAAPSMATNCNAVNGTFIVFPPQNGVQVFNNNPYEKTIAHSGYNSFQASVRHNSAYASFLVGYTFSKCRDDASELLEGVNPFDPNASTSLCSFDVTHNFVASYDVKLPFDRAFHTTSGWANRLAGGWAISGVTSFATGLPVSFSESDDQSLTGTANTSAPIDLPDFTPGPLYDNRNPRSGQPYFNVNLYSQESPGTIGNTPRRFFHGPGLNNWDMALLKDTRITESKSLEFRFEAFNTWNHAQFENPVAAFGASNFGFSTVARDPRIMQAAVKLLF